MYRFRTYTFPKLRLFDCEHANVRLHVLFRNYEFAKQRIFETTHLPMYKLSELSCCQCAIVCFSLSTNAATDDLSKIYIDQNTNVQKDIFATLKKKKRAAAIAIVVNVAHGLY